MVATGDCEPSVSRTKRAEHDRRRLGSRLTLSCVHGHAGDAENLRGKLRLGLDPDAGRALEGRGFQGRRLCQGRRDPRPGRKASGEVSHSQCPHRSLRACKRRSREVPGFARCVVRDLRGSTHRLVQAEDPVCARGPVDSRRRRDERRYRGYRAATVGRSECAKGRGTGGDGGREQGIDRGSCGLQSAGQGEGCVRGGRVSAEEGERSLGGLCAS